MIEPVATTSNSLMLMQHFISAVCPELCLKPEYSIIGADPPYNSNFVAYASLNIRGKLLKGVGKSNSKISAKKLATLEILKYVYNPSIFAYLQSSVELFILNATQ